MFADDTMVYKTHNNLRYLKWCLEQDMITLMDWFKANKLTNLNKTACILVKKVEISQRLALKWKAQKLHPVMKSNSLDYGSTVI